MDKYVEVGIIISGSQRAIYTRQDSDHIHLILWKKTVSRNGIVKIETRKIYKTDHILLIKRINKSRFDIFFSFLDYKKECQKVLSL